MAWQAITGVITGISNLLAKREEKQDTRFLISTINKLRKKSQVAEDYMEADMKMILEDNEKRKQRWIATKERLRDRFQKFKV